ncbi:hypothetical protein FJZ53_05115 [Candidatus Woesearchaeota archaeon]|nr:hypothetical protein [Candidatus Woesearchaeota archaeon]
MGWLRFIAKRVVFYGSVLAFLNYFGSSVCSFGAAKWMKHEVKDRRIQQVCKVDENLESIVDSIDIKGCDALKLLKTAHALVSKQLDYTASFWCNEKERAYVEGKADCRYFAAFTYSNFLSLADKLGRSDLKDKVRICMGLSSDGNRVDAGHVWLQFYDGGRWRDYETTNDLFDRDDNIDFGSIDNLIPDYAVLDYTTCVPSSWITYNNGDLEDNTDFLFSFNTGIEARHLYSYVKNEILPKSVTTDK